MGIFGNQKQNTWLPAATLLLCGAGLTMQVAPVQAWGQDTARDGAQGEGDGRRAQMAGMARVAGEVTAVAGNTLTLRTEDGTSAKVVTTDNTRLMKDRGPVRVGDLHPGDGLMAFGNLDAPNHTLHAAMVMATDASEIKAMRENLGKTYITGRVTAINLDDAKMTVERGDHVAQTIGFDETTSFRRAVRGPRAGGGPGGNSGDASPDEAGAAGNNRSGAGSSRAGGLNGGRGGGLMAAGGLGLERAYEHGESITLADIKVGDLVAGTGSVKGGVFVPVHLVDSPPGQRRGRPGGNFGGSVGGNAAGTGQPGAPPAVGGPGAR